MGTPRKPLAEGCNGGITCPIEGHVRLGEGRWSRRYSHIALTRGQKRTLYERRNAEREGRS